ncbi:hypothetical protein HS041_22565 [Planomonospora sp. ID67723]|uniref:hypothetical protein n=1 Tax=Planomonospora sp. ID67723 TaxID=2738134 RepID=UPI0018C3C4B0|nr:hypothetical protein [Planomonospora sp. ID67723]MBG0830549.1 hypothetical protein [Planomonospora sp. ID67723]
MVTDAHIEFIREQLAAAERDVAGWRQILGHAEQVARAGTVLPDPMADAFRPAAYPVVPETGSLLRIGAPPAGRPPYEDPRPTGVMPIIPPDGSPPPLKPGQEAAFAAFERDHDELQRAEQEGRG